MIGAARPVSELVSPFRSSELQRVTRGEGCVLMEIIRGLEDAKKKMIYDKKNKA